MIVYFHFTHCVCCQKSFEWLIGLEEELKIVDPPEIAIEKEIQLVGKK